MPAMTQIVTPYLLYEDVAAALSWLDKAFGFREELRWAGEDGVVAHAEMSLGDGAIMLGHPGPDYESPHRHGHATVLIAVQVDDVDGHYERARAAGAKAPDPPEDKPSGTGPTWPRTSRAIAGRSSCRWPPRSRRRTGAR